MTHVENLVLQQEGPPSTGGQRGSGRRGREAREEQRPGGLPPSVSGTGVLLRGRAHFLPLPPGEGGGVHPPRTALPGAGSRACGRGGGRQQAGLLGGG